MTRSRAVNKHHEAVGPANSSIARPNLCLASRMFSSTYIIEPVVPQCFFKSSVPPPICVRPGFNWFLPHAHPRHVRVVDWGFAPSLLETSSDPTGKTDSRCAGIGGSTTTRVICMTRTQANNYTRFRVWASLLSSSPKSIKCRALTSALFIMIQHANIIRAMVDIHKKWNNLKPGLLESKDWWDSS